LGSSTTGRRHRFQDTSQPEHLSYTLRHDRTSTHRPTGTLQPEQLGKLTVCTPSALQPVHAWIVWEDGVEELVQAHAVAWTKRAGMALQRV
jgi:hypothetical protein